MTFGGSIIPLAGLQTAEFLLRPLVEADAHLDYEAVMESKEFLRKWEQSTWPADDFTVEANRNDMIKMQRRHTTGEAFGYTVMNLDQTECLGCVYVSSPNASWFADAVVTAVGPYDWADCDAMISFWVRKSRMEQGLDRTLLATLRTWFDHEWSFTAAVFMTNEEFVQQVELFESANLERRFEAKLPSSSGRDFAYA